MASSSAIANIAKSGVTVVDAQLYKLLGPCRTGKRISRSPQPKPSPGSHRRRDGAPGFVDLLAVLSSGFSSVERQQGDKDRLDPLTMAQAGDEPASHAAVPSNESDMRRDPLAVAVDLDNQVRVGLTPL
jgi:hypothetical protein